MKYIPLILSALLCTAVGVRSDKPPVSLDGALIILLQLVSILAGSLL